ncbi:hypothetical protein [Ferrimonas balearica]|uniref:hypothetical protein n=1 Tax=Ferrimonas balearica TaxID=44012 RepID=UPI001C98E7AA|nr:hypothetical protein [Ferrimonas balearica]MBY5992419.1 hypothetical protein [Ferrimonas balearica]
MHTDSQRERFIVECRRQLQALFERARCGDSEELDKARTQGFIRAGEFMGLIERAESLQMMEEAHFQVFGESIAERQRRKAILKSAREGDYSLFDIPPSER